MSLTKTLLTVAAVIAVIVAIVLVTLSLIENSHSTPEAPPTAYEAWDVKLIMTNPGQPFYIQRIMAFDSVGHNVFQGLPSNGIAYNPPVYPAGTYNGQLDNIFSGRAVSYWPTQAGDQATISLTGKTGSTPPWDGGFTQLVIIGDFSGQHNSSMNGLQWQVNTGKKVFTSKPAVVPASLDQRNANGVYRPVVLRFYPGFNLDQTDIEVSSRMPQDLNLVDANWV